MNRQLIHVGLYRHKGVLYRFRVMIDWDELMKKKLPIALDNKTASTGICNDAMKIIIDGQHFPELKGLK